jgi:hypothetical protein
MENITIPSEADMQSLDQTTFVWDDAMDGTLTLTTSSALKAVLDEITATDVVINLNEQNAATGKTAKFILDNVPASSNWKIVSTDFFQDTFLTTSEYFDNVGNAANVYKNDLSGSTEIEFDEAGNAVTFRQVDIHNDNAVVRTIDLTTTQELLGVNDLVDEAVNAVPKSHLVNAAGTALDSTGSFVPDVEVLSTWTISNGFPISEANGVRLAMIRAIKRLPTNGLLVIPFFNIPLVNNAYWDVAQALQLTGTTIESEYRMNTESDGSGAWQVCVIKKV